MKVTSKERIIIERFKPYKVIDIYHNGKLIYKVKTEDTTATLAELKRQYRHTAKIDFDCKRFKRLAIADGENGFYSLRFCDHYRNMSDEYEAMKKLKEQLEHEHADTIRVTTGGLYGENSTSRKDYRKQFKIVYVNWVA